MPAGGSLARRCVRLRAWLAVGLVLLAGCGSVGEPLPPLRNVPGRVEDFTARQSNDQLVAAWTWPLLGTEGQTYLDVERFELFALDITADAPTPSAETMQRLAQPRDAWPVEQLAASGPGSRIEQRVDAGPHRGQRTAFAVLAVSNRGKTSPWSDVRILEIISPPEAPGGLTAAAQGEGVLLRWQPLSQVAAYVVERRIADGDYAVLGRVEDAEFLDRGPLWGAAHAYRVRSERRTAAPDPVDGPPSTPVILTPMDVFAPAVPRELRAVATGDAVELSWVSNEEADLAGYRVLRDGAPLDSEPIPDPTYRDAAIEPGGRYAYSVTAVDRLGNESEPSAPIEVSTPPALR